MGFKQNQNKSTNNTTEVKKTQKKTIQTRPTNRRCASTIMEQYSDRIDIENCRNDLKALLKKCLFKIVAAESVDQEICFLNEVKQLLESASENDNDNNESNPRRYNQQNQQKQKQQYDSLKLLVKELYQIAVDKQIDQYYHQSSKYIDHLNVHDESFRLYTLRNFQTLTSNTSGDRSLTFTNILNYNQNNLGINLHSNRQDQFDLNNHQLVEDDDDDDSDDNAIAVQNNQSYNSNNNRQQQIQSTNNNNNNQMRIQQNNIIPSNQQQQRNNNQSNNTNNRINNINNINNRNRINNNIQNEITNRQLTRSINNRTNFNFYPDSNTSTSSNSIQNEVSQQEQSSELNEELDSFSFETSSQQQQPMRIRYQTNNNNNNNINQNMSSSSSVVRVNFIDQHIMTGDNDYRISYINHSNNNSNNTSVIINQNNNNNNIRRDDQKDHQPNSTSSSNIFTRNINSPN